MQDRILAHSLQLAFKLGVALGPSISKTGSYRLTGVASMLRSQARQTVGWDKQMVMARGSKPWPFKWQPEMGLLGI